ncbi:MAG: flagellar motor switch protein FliM [Peptococcaceae bacterium]|nr:flagellar motor switch protein FliM [Peptococcaceae bacterium]
MEDALSQSEIDQLLKAMGDGNLQPEQLESSPASKVRNYDFKRPNKFSKDQVNTLHNIYENYIRSLSTQLSSELHAVIETHLVSIEQITYLEFIRSLPNPSIIGICNLEPLGNAMIDISPGLALTMVDLLLGGQGESSQGTRELTEIERLIVEKRIKAMVELLPEAWENIIPLEATLLSVETNPQFTQVVAGTEMVALATIEVKVGSKNELVHMCLPYLVLEPVLPKLSTQVWFTTKQPQPTDKSELLRRIDKVKVPIKVQLGTASISVQDLLNISVGDVIPLNRKLTEPMEVLVGREPKFLGVPGIVGNKVAVQITERLEEGDD